jgi:hypothetical protein
MHALRGRSASQTGRSSCGDPWPSRVPARFRGPCRAHSDRRRSGAISARWLLHSESRLSAAIPRIHHADHHRLRNQDRTHLDSR